MLLLQVHIMQKNFRFTTSGLERAQQTIRETGSLISCHENCGRRRRLCNIVEENVLQSVNVTPSIGTRNLSSTHNVST